jgi:lysyl-tRNA synthetase, class II
VELDFREPFKKYDVMTEIGVDPLLLENLPELDKHLISKIRGELLPVIARSDKSRAVKIDSDLDTQNSKQLLDLMIEEIIETKCTQPSFIMNHPLVMSPLAKSHAQG